MDYTRLPESDAAVETAARHVQAGGLLVHPTTGVYGIGGRRDPAVETAVARLKERAAGAVLIYLVDGEAGARRAFPDLGWEPPARLLAERFWPGPLTLVLADGSESGRAIRSEGHPFTAALVRAAGRAVSSTSMNRSGEPPARSPAEVARVLDGVPTCELPVLWIDAGELPGPPPSTLVRLRDGRIEVLREGAVPRSAIDAAIEAAATRPEAGA
ncbi:MAG: L-threonylcarbamoyladenylate synthase [Gemmatimonadota bacterium]